MGTPSASAPRKLGLILTLPKRLNKANKAAAKQAINKEIEVEEDKREEAEEAEEDKQENNNNLDIVLSSNIKRKATLIKDRIIAKVVIIKLKRLIKI